MRSIFIHVGLHKTGTTALQSALAENAEWLQNHHYRFPQATRAWAQGGHHNLAWEITKDRRFHASCGTMTDLLAEVRGSDYNIILSSEDFIGAVARGGEFQHLTDALKRFFPMYA